MGDTLQVEQEPIRQAETPKQLRKKPGDRAVDYLREDTYLLEVGPDSKFKQQRRIRFTFTRAYHMAQQCSKPIGDSMSQEGHQCG